MGYTIYNTEQHDINPIWDSDFFPSPPQINIMLLLFHLQYIIQNQSKSNQDPIENQSKSNQDPIKNQSKSNEDL